MRIAFVVSAAMLMLPAVARAETGVPLTESGAPCASRWIPVPPELPANVPGLFVDDSFEEADVSLLASDGTTVSTELIAAPTVAGSKVLAIRGALVVGATYTVRWVDECAGVQTRSFVATAAAPMPTNAGRLVPGAAEERAYCDRSVLEWSMYRSISLIAAEELAPFRALARGALVTDGVERGAEVASPNVGGVHLRCPSAATTKRVYLRVVLPNGPTIVTPEIDVAVQCPSAPPMTCPDRPTDPGSSEAPTADGGFAASPSGDGPSTARYGCTMEHAAPNGAPIALLLALAALRRAKRGAASRTSRSPSDGAR